MSPTSIHVKAVVSAKGQVVIPRILRERLGIHAGSELLFTMHDDTIEITPVKRSIDMLFGCCKDETEESISLSEMDEAIMQAVSENDVKTKKKYKKGRS